MDAPKSDPWESADAQAGADQRLMNLFRGLVATASDEGLVALIVAAGHEVIRRGKGYEVGSRVAAALDPYLDVESSPSKELSTTS